MSHPQVEYDAAVNELERLNSQVTVEGLDLSHTKDTTESVMKAAEEQLKRTEIHSPFDGILTIINYNDNAFVTTNAALFTVASPITYVDGEVNEEDVGALLKGIEAEIRLYSYGSQTFDATLDAVLPSPVANTSRYTINLHPRQAAGKFALRFDRGNERYSRPKTERDPRPGARREHRPGAHRRGWHRRTADGEDRLQGAGIHGNP